jgi:hypothetical protein
MLGSHVESLNSPTPFVKMQQKLRRTIVKKSIFAVLLIASAAMAADKTSVARPDVIPGSPTGSHPFLNVKAIQAAGTEVFVSDAVNNVVNIYNTKGKQLGQLTGFSEPQGLASDTKKNLYVADTANSRVQIYASPYKKAKTLSDPSQYPAGVAQFNNGKVVGVTNIISTSGGPGSVTIYKNGKAGAAISSTDFARVYFDAFDAKGNLYIDGENSNGGVVVGVIEKAATTGKKITTLTTGNSITFPGGIQVSLKGQIIIDDQEGEAAYTYKAPVKGSLGSPVATTAFTGASDPVTFAISSTDKDVWTADAGLAQSNEYAYPKGGSPVDSISVSGGEPIGVAVTPAQK